MREFGLIAGSRLRNLVLSVIYRCFVVSGILELTN